MKALTLLVALQFACRLLGGQPFLEAAASTAFLLLFVAICHRWGGWTSAATAWTWLKARPLSAWLVGTGTAGVVGLTIHNGGFSPTSITAETIGAYFFFHAFCAVGDRLTAA